MAEVKNDDKLERYHRLQQRLVDIYKDVFPDPLAPRTVVVIPSLTLDPRELAKITGAHHYEERMLFLVMLLQMPQTQLIYVTSQPIPTSVIDYFLHLLPGIPSTHARRRLKLLACHDASPQPLVQKILDRPRLIAKIRKGITCPESAHISCFNSTDLERELALKLGIPLYATNPDLKYLGYKGPGREIMTQAGIQVPTGMEHLGDENAMITALHHLKQDNPGLRKAVIKLNEGFSGEGNAVFSLADCPEEGIAEWITANLPEGIQFEAAGETWARYCDKFRDMQGIVEEFVEGEEKRSPSVQCRINPVGEVQVISTHDQILGGPSGQIFLGCTFPADPDYRVELQEAGRRVGEVLRDRGVIGRFGVDFVSVKQPDGWKHYAIEINLRKGGTTHTFMMLKFITNGEYDCDTGEFIIPGGESRCYFASDNVCSDSLKGLCPDDLIDIAVEHNLHFHSTIQQGVVFHLIGALSEFGKLGMVCIGDTPESAQAFHDQTLKALENANRAML
ncbi:MAG: peptide ligase PGM1-related protein [Pirellulaceae bacterium]